MLEEELTNLCALDPRKPIVAGVSGGADSLCLMDILQGAGYPVIVASFNHQLRTEAEAEIRSLADLANQRGLPFVTDQGDVKAYATENRLTLEESARILRYRFLFATAENRRAQAVAVGHTADDQVETVLMHFLRGAGLAGLKGMEYRSLLPVFHASIPLVRPLLSLWRSETEAYCREHELHPHEDATNSDPSFFRNRLRHVLIPELEKYNPRFKNALLRTSLALQGDASIVLEAMHAVWEKVLQERGENWTVFKRSELLTIPRAYRRNVFRMAAESLHPDTRDFGFDVLERAVKFSELPGNNQMDFSSGLYLFTEGESLYLAAFEADLPHGNWPIIEKTRELEAGQDLDLGHGWILCTRLLPADAERETMPADNWKAWLDADRVGKTLRVRSRQPGDVFTPLGMSGKKVKIQDYYVNGRLPRRARTHWPLVCSREDIVWVPGFGISHESRITENTRNVIEVSIQKK